MNGTPNTVYTMQDPYVKGTQTPWPQAQHTANPPSMPQQYRPTPSQLMPPQQMPQPPIPEMPESSLQHGLSEDAYGLY